MKPLRKIIHVDMDAFYASVEQRDNPDLKGKPVIVGGTPDSRGVVAACSYEARKFGIHSAMPSATAYRLCPQAVFIRPNFTVYRAVSAQIREIFHDYTDLVEPLSLDEAFLDVTENKKNMASATRIAEKIREQIRRATGLTASAGVSFNKFLAKVASDVNKPDGLTVITPKEADGFIDSLPIGRFFGVGNVTEKKMLKHGIKTGRELKQCSRDRLVSLFGKTGSYYYAIAHGEDNRPVSPDRERKSLGKETTLAEDITDRAEIKGICENLAESVGNLLVKNKIQGKTITLKVKYFDFTTITRSITLEEPVRGPAVIKEQLPGLLEKTEAGEKEIRLLGVTVSNFLGGEERGGSEINQKQMELQI